MGTLELSGAPLDFVGWITGLGMIASIIYNLHQDASKERAAKRDNEIALQQNKQALNSVPGFSSDIVFAGGTGEGGIALDVATNRFATVQPGKSALTHSFDDLVSVHLERDGETVHQTDRGSQAAGAAVGAALFGGVGFLVGGLTGASRTTKKISRLSLKFYMTDVRTPVVEVVFFYRAKAVSANDVDMKARASQMEEWYARFQAVLYSRRNQGQQQPDPMVVGVPR